MAEATLDQTREIKRLEWLVEMRDAEIRTLGTENDTLREENELLLEGARISTTAMNQAREKMDALRAEVKELRTDKQRRLEEPLSDEWVKVFDDMVLVQQRTEAERERLKVDVEAERDGRRILIRQMDIANEQLRAENERLKEVIERSDPTPLTTLAALRAENERLRAALDSRRADHGQAATAAPSPAADPQ